MRFYKENDFDFDNGFDDYEYDYYMNRNPRKYKEDSQERVVLLEEKDFSQSFKVSSQDLKAKMSLLNKGFVSANEMQNVASVIGEAGALLGLGKALFAERGLVGETNGIIQSIVEKIGAKTFLPEIKTLFLRESANEDSKKALANFLTCIYILSLKKIAFGLDAEFRNSLSSLLKRTSTVIPKKIRDTFNENNIKAFNTEILNWLLENENNSSLVFKKMSELYLIEKYKVLSQADSEYFDYAFIFGDNEKDRYYLKNRDTLKTIEEYLKLKDVCFFKLKSGILFAELNNGEEINLNDLIVACIQDFILENQERDFYLGDNQLNEKIINRKVKFFLGSTNSGKTYNALSLIQPETKGCYLAPLRLLAIEIYEKLNAQGIKCSLLTGEEKIIVEGANFVSSTIENFDASKDYDLVIVDEYQLISDIDRGKAWGNAIFKASTNTLCLVGSANYANYLEYVLQKYYPQNQIEKQYFDRLSTLTYQKKPINTNQLEKGDAVIVFSKNAVLEFTELLSSQGYKVASLYGDMALEVRKKQAEMFAEGEFDVLVATDVIGLGLNLPIKRIVFAQGAKFDGRIFRNITQSEFRQIAGRAGRYNQDGSVAILESHIISRDKLRKNTLIGYMEEEVKNKKVKDEYLNYIPLPVDKALLVRFDEKDVIKALSLLQFALCCSTYKKEKESSEEIDDCPLKMLDEFNLSNLKAINENVKFKDHNSGRKFNLSNPPVSQRSIAYRQYCLYLKGEMSAQEIITQIAEEKIKGNIQDYGEMEKILALLRWMSFQYPNEVERELVEKCSLRLSNDMMREYIFSTLVKKQEIVKESLRQEKKRKEDDILAWEKREIKISEEREKENPRVLNIFHINPNDPNLAVKKRLLNSFDITKKVFEANREKIKKYPRGSSERLEKLLSSYEKMEKTLLSLNLSVLKDNPVLIDILLMRGDYRPSAWMEVEEKLLKRTESLANLSFIKENYIKNKMDKNEIKKINEEIDQEFKKLNLNLTMLTKHKKEKRVPVTIEKKNVKYILTLREVLIKNRILLDLRKLFAIEAKRNNADSKNAIKTLCNIVPYNYLENDIEDKGTISKLDKLCLYLKYGLNEMTKESVLQILERIESKIGLSKMKAQKRIEEIEKQIEDIIKEQKMVLEKSKIDNLCKA